MLVSVGLIPKVNSSKLSKMSEDQQETVSIANIS